VVDEESPVTIDLLANDSDPDGVLMPGSVQVVSGPANGTVVVDLTTGAATYVAAPNFSGLDAFTYQVCDDDGACDTAVVSIVIHPVNDAPLAVSDVYTTSEDITLNVTSPGVLSNDTDQDVGDTLTASVASGSGAGLLTLNSDGSFTYQPNLNFNGVDTFTYQACDTAGACASAEVTITVMSVNDPPVAVDDVASTAEDTLEVIAVLANDSDVDGPDPLSIVAVSIPLNGTVTSNGLNLTYYPNLNFYGNDTFTYTISDGLLTAAAVVTVSVEPVNDAPVATDDGAYTLSDLPVLAPGVLSNDVDLDGNPLIAILETGPASGNLVLNADGSFDYTPIDPLNFTGDSFTYRASDGVVASNPATVTINP
jgi:VCBS repeat-containing protein